MAAGDAQGAPVSLKAPSSALSRAWAVGKKHVAGYTGGKVQAAAEAPFVAALCSEDVCILDLETGLVTKRLQEALPDTTRDAVVTFALHPNDKELVTAGSNLMLRRWMLETGECVRAWRAHKTPVLSMAYEATGTLLATGGSDRTIFVWDVEKGFATHCFRGHAGIVSFVGFHSTPAGITLASCCDTAEVRLWDLQDANNHKLLKNHMSTVTGALFLFKGRCLVTAARDKMVNFWDTTTGALISSLPIYEAVEGLAAIPLDTPGLPVPAGASPTNVAFFATAGQKGSVRVWLLANKTTTKTGAVTVTCTAVQEQPEALGARLSGLEAIPLNNRPAAAQYGGLMWTPALQRLLGITLDHALVLLAPDTLSLKKRIIGYNDDIIDVKYVPEADAVMLPRRIVVATNSEQLRLFNLDTFACDVFIGHEAVILSCDVSPDGKYVATVAKDKTARIWDVQSTLCVAVCDGHTEAVAACAWPKRRGPFGVRGTPWLLTAGQDLTVKVWDLKGLFESIDRARGVITSSWTIQRPSTLTARKAHDKDINALAVAPNDALCASASQDKTIKLFKLPELDEIGVLRGHRRGVWSVEFSPVEQVLVSASADRTIRLWSVTDFSCIKTLEGHTASVLNVRFIRAGMQLVSSGADGLIKLWTLKDSECINTYDNHTEKVWALAVRRANCPGADAEMVSGGGDSVLCVWNDVTKQEDEDAIRDAEEKLLQQQELYGAMARRDYEAAIVLCLELEQPLRLQAILEELLFSGPLPTKAVPFSKQMYDEISLMNNTTADESKDDAVYGSKVGQDLFCRLVKTLELAKLAQLVRLAREWNTKAKFSLLAQLMLSLILRSVPLSTAQSLPDMASVIKAVLPYTERHFTRLERLVQQSYLIDYALVRMDALVPIDAATASPQPVVPLPSSMTVQPIDGAVHGPVKRRAGAAPEVAEGTAESADGEGDGEAAAAGTSKPKSKSKKSRVKH